MKENSKIKLMQSQITLLQIKSNEIQRARDEFQEALNLITTEQGVPEGERNQWILTDEGQAIEKIEKSKSDN